jgi:hypothetical protein
MPLAPGDGRDPSALRQPVLRLAVRRGPDRHPLDMPFRIGAAQVSGMPSGESLGKPGLKGRGDRSRQAISVPLSAAVFADENFSLFSGTYIFDFAQTTLTV